MTNTLNVSKRGRPRKFDAQKGIQLSKKLFRQYGFDGLGVAKICSTLNITPTSLYGTYKSKFELFSLVLNDYKEDYFSGLKDLLLESDSVADVFRGTLEFSLNYYTKNSDYSGCLLLNTCVQSNDKKVISLAKQKTLEIEYFISQRLAELGAENAEELASVIITLLHGLSSETRAGKSDDDLFVTLEFLCATFDC